MNNIVGSYLNIVPKEETDANLEFDKIVSDSRISDVLKEVSRFRIWRMHKTGSWRSIVDDNGNPMYEIWEDVVTKLSEILDCGRQQIYDRVRIYEQLNWLGYTDQESIQMIADRPYLYTRTLDMVVDWNQREEKPRSILIPELANASEDKAKEHLRSLLDDVDAFDTQKEALRFVSETVMSEPQVDLWYDGDVVRAIYYKSAIDEKGNKYVEDYGTVTFYPDGKPPAWVMEKLEKSFRSVGKYYDHKNNAAFPVKDSNNK